MRGPVVRMGCGPLLGSRPTDNELVTPDLDADDPSTVRHLLCDRHDPAQDKLDLRLLDLRLFARRAARTCLAAAGAREHAEDLVADLFGVGVEVEQNPGGDPLVLADE